MAGSSSPGHGLRRAALITAMACTLISSPISAKKEDSQHAYGPEPSGEEFRKLAEARIRDMLVDPDSARIEWTHGMYKGGYTPLLESRIYGYAACGFVNAKNRMGGYSGPSAFLVVVDYDRVLYADMDKPSGSFISDACRKGIRAGKLPLLPNGPISSDKPTIAAVDTGFDFTTSIVPDGLYVKTVTAGGAAEKVGLKPGMVIADLNGISLKGMDAAVTGQLLQGASGEVTLTIIGLGLVKLKKPPPVTAPTTMLPTNIEGM